MKNNEVIYLLHKEILSKEESELLLNSQKRQVKWLYNNSNKLTIVYEEKFVRALIQRLLNYYDK